MHNTRSKDELVELLKEHRIDEFNESRPLVEDATWDFTEIDLSGIELTGANFSYADLTGSDFGEAVLNEVDFTGCDLTSVNFSRANISAANFSNTIMNGTKFNSSTVEDSDFADADLSGTDFSDADLSSSDFALAQNMSMCRFDSYTVWPEQDALPEDFESEYIEDLASLSDEDDSSDGYDF